MHVRIGTRKSQLAFTQAQELTALLEKMHYSYEIISIITSGDKVQDKPLYEIGGKALFLKELEIALLNNQIDIAVHSFKDVPAKLTQGLLIAGVLERKTPNDALVCFKGNKIYDLPNKAKVGTSSLRRKVQLLSLRPDLEVIDCRGNVTTRIAKFMDKKYDAIILAASALERLNIFDNRYCSIIPISDMLPAAGQGTIALEVRSNDEKMLDLCKQVNHERSWDLQRAERGFIETINGDCKTPLAALAKDIGDNKVRASFLFGDLEKIALFSCTQTFKIKDAYENGKNIAKIILNITSK